MACDLPEISMGISTSRNSLRILITILISVLSSVTVFLVLRYLRTESRIDELNELLVYITVQAWLMPFIFFRKDILFSERRYNYKNVDLTIAIIFIVVMAITLPKLIYGLTEIWLIIILSFSGLWVWLNSFLVRNGNFLMQSFARLIIVLLSYGSLTLVSNIPLIGTYLLGMGLALGLYIIYVWRRGHFEIGINELGTGLKGFSRNNIISTFSYLSQTHLPVLAVPVFFGNFDLYTILITLRLLAFPFTSISGVMYSRSFSLQSGIKGKFREEIIPFVFLLLALYAVIVLVYRFWIVDSFNLSDLPVETLLAWSLLYTLRSGYNSYVRIFYSDDVVLERFVAVLMFGALMLGLLIDYLFETYLIFAPIMLALVYLFAYHKLWVVSK